MSLDVVRNVVNRVLLTAKFNEFASMGVIRHASHLYTRPGIHLNLIRLEVTFKSIMQMSAEVMVGFWS
jgi:hypothetical protein